MQLISVDVFLLLLFFQCCCISRNSRICFLSIVSTVQLVVSTKSNGLPMIGRQRVRGNRSIVRKCVRILHQESSKIDSPGNPVNTSYHNDKLSVRRFLELMLMCSSTSQLCF